MSGKKRAEAAEMESTKKDALHRVEPVQGGQSDKTRRPQDTPSPCPVQEHHSQPAAAQRARLLAMLKRAPVSTLEARAVNIMSPATRIFELKMQGREIITTRLPNRVGVYHLVGEANHGE